MGTAASTRPVKPLTHQGDTQQPVLAPPLSAFLRLLTDSDRVGDLKQLLRKYPDPSKQQRLLRILQDAKFSHELRTTLSRKVSDARSWFKKRDRWRTRVRGLDKELEKLLIQFRDSVYPVLRASNRLPASYSRDLADLFTAIQRVQELTQKNPLLSQVFTTRGHQAQPYLGVAVKAMRAIGVTKADAQDILIWTGVKHDTFAS